MPRRLKKPKFPEMKLPPHHHDGPCSCAPGVAYIRVSMVGKRDRIISPELQLDSIVAYAKANSIRLVGIYSDIDRSGRTFRKRSVDKIIEQIKVGAFEWVVLWKWSRWARNTYESTRYLLKVKEAGGRVDSATEDADQETALGRLQLDLVMRIDQYQSEAIGEGWDSAHGKRREAGLPHDGKPRFGYNYIRHVEMVDGYEQVTFTYERNEEEAAALAAAYHKIIDGVSWGRTARWLNDQGFRTTGGELWVQGSLSRTLDTGFAAGYIRERSAPTEKSVYRIWDFDVWRLGAHKPIIEEETWTRYRDLRLSRRRFKTNSAVAVHDLSGLLNCAECLRSKGLRVTLQTRHNPGHSWVCAERVTHHPDVNVSVSNLLALKAVKEWVREVAGIGEDVDPRARMIFERRMAEDPNAPDPDKISAEIRHWKRKLKNLRDLYTDGGTTREEYDESRAEYGAELRKREMELEGLMKTAASRPDYTAFRTLDELWSQAEPGKMRDPLAALAEVILVGPRKGSTATRASAAARMEFVGRWDSERISEIQ